MKQLFKTFFVVALILVFSKGLATAEEEAATANQFKTYKGKTGKWIEGDPETGRTMFYDPKARRPAFSAIRYKIKEER